MEEEKVRKGAKALMDEFMAAIEAAEGVEEDVGIEMSDSTRKAGKCELTEGFPERMLKNAPAKKDRHVVAEKKQW
ncbi:hypothetical protein J4470_04555 [Candidatus Woesearchaeota archaeon]|nr:hypothetical protein [Candidatus Woesearchaeota archaeon]